MAKPPAIPYNWNNPSIKLWDDTLPSSEFASTIGPGALGFTYQQWPNGQLAPVSQDWNSGYDARASQVAYQNRWRNLLKHANANFCNSEYYVPLFVNDLKIDLGISGTTAQSQKTRDFYPHNITIPSFTIQGQCYSTAHYGALTEYIHMSQHNALINHSGTPDLVQFYLARSIGTVPEGGRTDGRKVTLEINNEKPIPHAYNQNIVGGHGKIMCLGYIDTISRSHQAGNHRPTWTAHFIVVQMLRSPLFTESEAFEKPTQTWLAMLHGTKSQNWLTKQNEKNNVKTLQSVAGATNNVISTLGGGGNA
jgi:hypothetical protein